MQERRADSPPPVSWAGLPAKRRRGTDNRGGNGARPVALRVALLLVIAASVVVVDQWSKSWALRALSDVERRHVIGPIYLSLTFNQGAAFSLGAGASPVIEAVAIALVVAMIAFSRRAAMGRSNLAVIVGLGLLLGGALSNLGDRLFRHHHGAVIDFIQLVSWWPTFNVADASITVGALTVVVALIFFPPAKRATGAERQIQSEKGLTGSPSQRADDITSRAVRVPGGSHGRR
jgi:signal peptidase II